MDAGELLGAAGRRAFARDDMQAAIKLLDRAVALLTNQHPARLELVRELSRAFWAVGELARAEALLDGILQAANAVGDRRIEWYALLERATRNHMTDPNATPEELQQATTEAIEVFEEIGDDAGLARAWRGPAESKTPSMQRNSRRENRETPLPPASSWRGPEGERDER